MKEKIWSPYLAGMGLGLTLLATFYIFGWGTGASSAFSLSAAVGIKEINPDFASTLKYFTRYLSSGAPLKSWIIFEIGGLFLGALIGTLLFGSFRLQIDRGPRLGKTNRIIAALAGGILIGFASRLARGCTSGVVLSGASQLAVAGWIFALAMFISGFIAAALFRRLWS
jgi:uncharacterized membrane protein YedE/YeeE